MNNPEKDLSRREREIMRIVYQKGTVTVSDVLHIMDNPPSPTALRTHFRILEQKGYVVSGKRARANIYRAKIDRAKVARPVLQGVLDSFFGGSIANAVASHLADPSLSLNDDELNRLQELINQRNKGKS